jgi:hypothetical protein
VISLDLPRRETKAHVVNIGDVRLYFSYRTLVGVSGPGTRVRCHNTWGPTTGKHINNDLDIRHFDIVGRGHLVQDGYRHRVRRTAGVYPSRPARRA